MGCLSEDQVLAFAGEPTGEVAEHLDACSDCRRLVMVLALDALPGSRADTALGPTAPAWGLTARSRLAPGTQIGRFTIQRVLGAGGMGTVYAARDSMLERDVALKELVRGSGDVIAEAQAAARLLHPNIVTVHEVVSHDDSLVIAMELVDGGTLTEHLARAPLTPRQLAALFEATARGLAAAHAAGVLHRDVKPANILVDRSGRPRLSDFGLAVASDQAAPGAAGTPGYVAPEVLAGAAPSARGDQFSFGVTLQAVASSGALLAIARRASDPDPDRRYPDLEAVATALAAVQQRSRAPWFALGGAGVTGIVAAIVLTGASPESSTPCAAASLGQIERPTANVPPPLAARLDAYATGVRELAAGLCGARTDAPTLHAMRTECVYARHHALTATRELLSHEALSNGARLLVVDELPALADCLDTAALERRPPPPPDPAHQLAVTNLRASLYVLRARAHAGEYGALIEPTQLALAAARRLGYQPLVSELQLLAGDLLRTTDRVDESEAAFHDAIAAGTEGRADVQVAEAWIRLVRLYAHMMRFHDSTRAATQARAAIARTGNPVALRAALAGAEAITRYEAGALADARTLATDAVALHRERVDADPVGLADALALQGLVVARSGEFPAAESLFEEALAIFERTGRADHPHASNAWRGRAHVQLLGARGDLGAAAVGRAIGILEATGLQTTRDYAVALAIQAASLRAHGLLAESRKVGERALAVAERTAGPMHTTTATALRVLAPTLAALGDRAMARTLLTRARAIYVAVGGPEFIEVALTDDEIDALASR